MIILKKFAKPMRLFHASINIQPNKEAEKLILVCKQEIENGKNTKTKTPKPTQSTTQQTAPPNPVNEEKVIKIFR